MPLNSIYNAVRQNPGRVKSIQEIMKENPSKRNMFADSDIVAGKNFSPIASLNSSTSVNAIAGQIASSTKTLNTIPQIERTWEKCKCLKQRETTALCQKFQMKCVKDKCPQKFMEF